MCVADLGVIEARALFPRGLAQPGHYRFAVDALLLAAFAAPKAGGRGLDLGAGCGVVGLALLLGRPGAGLAVTAVDADPAMAAAARANAARLGLSDVFDVIEADVSSYQPEAGAYDFVVCNPPFREPGSGRGAADAARQRARFATAGELDGFWAAAGQGLRRGGAAWLVFLPERLADLFAGLRGRGLEPKRLRLVHGGPEAPARLALVEARKGGRPGLAVEPPLVLYDGNEGGKESGEGGGEGRRAAGQSLTDQALAFCPFLQCNARRPGA